MSTRAVLVVAGFALGTASCAAFFYGPSEVEAVNHSSDPVEVLFAADLERGTYLDLEPGESAEFSWPSCADAWVVVRYDGEELFREQLRVCPDDQVDVSLNRVVTVECGRLSARERDC